MNNEKTADSLLRIATKMHVLIVGLERIIELSEPGGQVADIAKGALTVCDDISTAALDVIEFDLDEPQAA